MNQPDTGEGFTCGLEGVTHLTVNKILQEAFAFSRKTMSPSLQ